MKRLNIVVTDLTRFANPDHVCLAGILIGSTECVRPMPYLGRDVCERLQIVPGVILRLVEPVECDTYKPHVEDLNYRQLEYNGVSTSIEFEKILGATAKPSIKAGFGGKVQDGSKVIPKEMPRFLKTFQHE